MIGVFITVLFILAVKAIKVDYIQAADLDRKHAFFSIKKKTLSIRFLGFFLRNRFLSKSTFIKYVAITWFLTPLSYLYFFVPSFGDIDGITFENGEYYFYEVRCDIDYDLVGREKDCYKNTFGSPLTQSEINKFNDLLEVAREANYKFEYYYSNPFGILEFEFLSSLLYRVVWFFPFFILLWGSSSPVFKSVNELYELTIRSRDKEKIALLKMLHCKIYFSTADELIKISDRRKSQILELLKEHYEVDYPEFSILKV